jgi:6-phosphogluconolactonase
MMASIVNSENHSEISIFRDIKEMSGAFFDFLIDEFTIALAEKRNYHLALSGGSTPVKIFEYLSRMPLSKMNWNFLHIYWGDERCVPPDDPESNFRNMWNAILRYVDIPEENVHRIRGEADPEGESKRYSGVLRKFTPSLNGFPQFDLILLGVGVDGHTASLFPDSMDLLSSDEFCYVALHPKTHQKRITLSLNVVNNSKTILFLATGEAKAGILETIIKKKKGCESLPSAYVKPRKGVLKWFLDAEAGEKIRK